MMKALCNLTTKKIEGFSRWDDVSYDPLTHIVIDVSDVPDMELDRLNDTNDGIRPATALELRPMSAVKDEKLKEAIESCDKSMEVITDLYPESEMKTWTIQELEASNFQHDVDNIVIPKRATPNLDWIISRKYRINLIDVTDVQRQALTTRILAKAFAYHEASSGATGDRQHMTDAIELAYTEAQAAIDAAVTTEDKEAAELAGIAALEAIVF